MKATQNQKITFIGATPPPYSGLTIMTEVVVRGLEARTKVWRLDWTSGKSMSGAKWKIYKIFCFMKTFFKVLVHGPKRGAVLYYPANSNWGMLYDIILIALSRLLGYRTILHHHVYSYIDRYDWRMALIVKLVGDKGAHAVHCELMKQHFKSRYSTKARFLFVQPTIASSELPREQLKLKGKRSVESRFELGFLSNITLEKGLTLVLETFERLAREGFDVGITLAGPCPGVEETQLIKSIIEEWPDRVAYIVPVYGMDKSIFYSKLDCFLFPTQYRNESWGIVLTEALSFGSPAIACSRGCIEWILQDGSGLSIDQGKDFVTEASTQLKVWIQNPDIHWQAREAALLRNNALEVESSKQFDQFLEAVIAF